MFMAVCGTGVVALGCPGDMAPKAMKSVGELVRKSALKEGKGKHIAKAKAKGCGKKVHFVVKKRPSKAMIEDDEEVVGCEEGEEEAEEEDKEEDDDKKPTANEYRTFWKALPKAKPEIIARVSELSKLGLRSGKRQEIAKLAKGFAIGGWDHTAFKMKETMEHIKSSKKADRAVPKTLMRQMCGGEAGFQEALVNGDIEEVVHPEDCYFPVVLHWPLRVFAWAMVSICIGHCEYEHVLCQ